jgi:hypothetical protein
LFRRAESNHTTSRLASRDTRKRKCVSGRCAIFSRLVLHCRCVVFPLSKKTRALAFCDVASRSYRAPPLPRART